ncbi:hypothetical protein BaRGS_00034260 [Batillaria attramentaria]|uniref:Sulfatase N-terminal domain-containing protein n=1 Tax=Batillaria attramentaria TaxID=370345 RepID=A0ABD0JHS2_9CAEN
MTSSSGSSSDSERRLGKVCVPVAVGLAVLVVESVLVLLLFLIYFPWGWGNEARRGAAPPNIVFVLADDLGFHDVGYHGSRIRTPNLDRLAAEGVKLENYYIHTGLQHRHIRSSQPNGLPLDSPTLADQLRVAGYSTHMVGKWHLGFYKSDYLPNNRGFDSFYGFLNGNEDYYTHMCVDRLDLYQDLRPDRSQNGTYSTHLFTEKAIRVIKTHNQSKPLFLYLAYQAVHGPLEVPDSYTEQYKDIKDTNRKIYAGMVTCMDEGIGALTGALQKAGLWQQTIFIFSTDNGGQRRRGGNNWPLRGNKNSLFEAGVRAVGFVTSPLLQKTGYVNTRLIHVSDWFPTLVGIAGFSGWSPPPEADPADLGLPPGSSHNEPNITDADKNIWLFNVAADPEERHDLSTSEPEVVRRLLDRLANYSATSVPPRYPADDPWARPARFGVWGPWRRW